MPDVTTLLSPSGGLSLAAAASATWEPPTVPPPATIPAGSSRIRALAYDSATVGSDVTYANSREATETRLHWRVLVSNVDVTYFRDVETPEPDCALIAPLLYGSTSLAFPQIHAAFETPGSGDLWWLTEFAPVVKQLVDDDGTVVFTEFRGFITDFDHSGKDFTCTIGGEAVGRASMQERQVPKFPFTKDIGKLGLQTIRHNLRLPIADIPATGIKMLDSGGSTQLDYLNTLCAQSTMLGGAQWTIMPDDAGNYAMFRKDVTTIDATVYLDDALAVPALRRDMTEEPNRVFATATNPNGFLIDFADYPGLTSAGRTAYPMAGSADMPPGTTDADTSTGGGVTALIWRLRVMGYLEDDTSGLWTSDPDDPVTDAVSDVQRAAGLLPSAGGSSTAGTVDVATWNALFDLGVTGYSLRRSQIKPAAAQPYTAPYLLNASGQILGRNPAFVASIPPVDLQVDMGAAWTVGQVRKWSKQELVDGSTSNWVGTITIGGGAVIAGEHNPGDPLTAGDLMDVRRVKPGMNLWLPLWDGGTLVHVSGRTGNQLSVDTRARDTMKVWEVIRRNRQSRRDPARQWVLQNRASTRRRDSMTGANILFGKVDDRRACPGGQWTVFPVLGGQEGTVQSIHTQTANAETVYALAIFGKRIWPAGLHRLVPDPLGDLGALAWTNNQKTLVDDHWLLAQWGDKLQPCGYYPKNLDPSSEDIPVVTGEFYDAGGFAYYCTDRISLWVAIYPIDDTHILPGRILRVQLDDQIG